MSRHTPGPWHIEGSWKRPATSEAGHIITHGLNSHGDGPEGHVCKTISTSPEDARLIAAAPDLLAALQALDKHAAAYVNFPQMPACSLGDAICIARKAIAKATGAA